MDKQQSTILQNETKNPRNERKEKRNKQKNEIKIRSHVRVKCCEMRTEFPLTK